MAFHRNDQRREGLKMSPSAYQKYIGAQSNAVTAASLTGSIGSFVLNRLAAAATAGRSGTPEMPRYQDMHPPVRIPMSRPGDAALDSFKQVDAFNQRRLRELTLDKSIALSNTPDPLRVMAQRAGFGSMDPGVLHLEKVDGGAFASNIHRLRGQPTVGVMGYPSVGTLAHELGHATQVHPGAVNAFRRNVLLPLMGIKNIDRSGYLQTGSSILAALAGASKKEDSKDRTTALAIAGLLHAPVLATQAEEIAADVHATRIVGGTLKTPSGRAAFARYLRHRAPSAATYAAITAAPFLSYGMGRLLSPDPKKYQDLKDKEEPLNQQDDSWDPDLPWVT